MMWFADETRDNEPRRYSLVESYRSLYVGRPLPRLVLIVSCYFDDSRGDYVHAIAGYLGLAETWENEFVPEWRAALSSGPYPLAEFKAVDCRHLVGEFNGWSREEAQAVALRCLEILGSHRYPTLFGIGAAVHLRATEASSSQEVLEKIALRIAFVEIVSVVLTVANLFGETDTVQCVCDEQPGLQGMLQDAFAFARETAMQGGAKCRISHLQFEDSKEVLPLQAADILAYETRKDFLNRIESPQRPRSRALAYLMREKPHLGFVLTADVINDTLRRLETHGSVGDSAPLLYWSDYVADIVPWIFASPPRMCLCPMDTAGNQMHDHDCWLAGPSLPIDNS